MKRETETTRKQQRQAHYSTSMRSSQNLSLQEMRIASQAVQISRFAKQGSLGGAGEAPQGSGTGAAIPSASNAALSGAVLKSTVTQ